MRRAAVFVLLTLLVGACESLRLPEAGRAAVDRGAPVLRDSLHVVWEHDVDAGLGAAPVLVAGQHVIVATRQGDLRAITLDGGRRAGGTSLGTSIDGRPLLVDGVVIVPIRGEGGGVLAYGLADGSTRWRHRAAPVETGAVLLRDAVVWADASGFVRAAERDDGRIRWEVRPHTNAVLAQPVVVGERLVVIYADGVMVVLDADGREEGRLELGQPVHAEPLRQAGRLIISTTRGRLIDVDLTVGMAITRVTEVAGDGVRLTRAAPVDGGLIVTGTDGVVRRLTDGERGVVWQRNVGAAVTAPPLAVGNRILVGTMDGRLVLIANPDGTLVSEMRVRGRVKSEMVAGTFGIIVASEPRHVYRLVDAEPSS